MGGKLFNLGRISRDRYLKIEATVQEYLDRKVGTAAYRIPRYYATKPDFGDIDVIIRSSDSAAWQNLRQEFVTDLAVTEFKSAGNVFSTVYQGLQVDYFTAAPEFLESTYNYLSFNDLGNLLGKICRRFNLKYGEEGLAYVFRRQDGNYKKDLTISTNFAEICRLLELNYAQWQQGFDELADVFNWVIASPYFSVNPYVNQSTSLEKRAKERTTIQKFLAYLEEQGITKEYQYLENRDDYLPWIAEQFPGADLLARIVAEQQLEERSIAFKAKFNGDRLMTLLPGISGKALGAFIVKLKEQIPDFEEYILTEDQEVIDQMIVDYFDSFACASGDRFSLDSKSILK
jgi:hypothetical protein